MKKSSKQQRRNELRRATADRIRWRTPSATATRHGWMSDTSPNSLSFIAASRYRPGVGDPIEVIRSDHTRCTCRVARVAPYDDDLSLIACTDAVATSARPTPAGSEDMGTEFAPKR